MIDLEAAAEVARLPAGLGVQMQMKYSVFEFNSYSSKIQECLHHFMPWIPLGHWYNRSIFLGTPEGMKFWLLDELFGKPPHA